MATPAQQNLAAARWTVRGVGDLSQVPAGIGSRVIPAKVPGCIHTDLIDAGLIPDPAIGMGEQEVQWVSWTDWRYEAEFDADAALFAHEELDLVFDSLDTIAVIEVNGVEVGRAASEFLPWRFSVRGVLKRGRNTLAVKFTSPLRFVQEEAARLGARPVNGEYPAYNMIRKCASNFEWDWGPKVATCGIAADVRLEGWNDVRIERIGARTSSTGTGRYAVDLDLSMQWSSKGEPSNAVLVGAGITGGFEGFLAQQAIDLAPGSPRVTLRLAIDSIGEWFPFTHGGQPRYTLNAWTAHGTTAAPAAWRHFGQQHALGFAFRTIRHDTPQDAGGLRFVLNVNCKPVFCRGANWIPEGLFPRDRSPKRIRERLLQLKAANMNMLRVWGGGRYEPDWFYDLCDELGILVWQDFMFACAMYPEEEPLWSLVEQEARHHVARLSRHPSVVLWCGGNECTWAHRSWGYKERLQPGQTWGERYYNELLPKICAEMNPTVPYIPNSPSSPDASLHPNDNTQGDQHVWDVWGEGYRTIAPRFCSEYGHQAPSNIGTLDKARLLPTPSLREGAGGGSSESPSVTARLISPALAARQRGHGGNKRWYDDPIAAWFRPPRDFDEWHYLTQLVQARSLTIAIDWHRANMPRCMGSLIWQLNDAWPGLSWALIDPEGRPKPAYGAVAQAFEDRRLTIQLLNGELCVLTINDTDEPWSDTLDLRRVAFDGAILCRPEPRPFDVPPRRVGRLDGVEQMLGRPADPSCELVVGDSRERHPTRFDEKYRATWFYLSDRELRYPEPRLAASIEHGGTSVSLDMRAGTLIRDAVLQIDRLVPGAVLHRSAPVTVLPGESFHLLVQRGVGTRELPPMSAEQLTSRPALMCANYFGKTP